MVKGRLSLITTRPRVHHRLAETIVRAMAWTVMLRRPRRDRVESFRCMNVEMGVARGKAPTKSSKKADAAHLERSMDSTRRAL